jgi:hypothetical protein
MYTKNEIDDSKLVKKKDIMTYVYLLIFSITECQCLRIFIDDEQFYYGIIIIIFFKITLLLEIKKKPKKARTDRSW